MLVDALNRHGRSASQLTTFYDNLSTSTSLLVADARVSYRFRSMLVLLYR